MATGRDIVNEVLLEDKLAQLWPDHRCLYDVSSAAFKNRDMRQQAMEEIGRKLDQNGTYLEDAFTASSSLRLCQSVCD